MDSLRIGSPKRNAASKSGWQGFFPYYAGFSETFARELIASSPLNANSVIWDPWNGSGTTTFCAASLGISAKGTDINPVMVIIAKARLLPYTETDSLIPLAEDILDAGRHSQARVRANEPLLGWFEATTATYIRNVERSLRRLLVGNATITSNGTDLSRLSSIAAALYVALFTTCRSHLSCFATSNPTWMRTPDSDRVNVSVSRSQFETAFREHVNAMAASMRLLIPHDRRLSDQAQVLIEAGDTTQLKLPAEPADLVLTSPPYCTRIDYAAATRIELALVEPWQNTNAVGLSRQMIGSTRVPLHRPVPTRNWGKKCISFLHKVREHPSKASRSYYLKNHLDYFDKMSRSMKTISDGLRLGGLAVFVVQDSYYKEIWNPLPDILSEMAYSSGLIETRREDFGSTRSMAGINRGSLAYRQHRSPTESVMCFQKQQG